MGFWGGGLDVLRQCAQIVLFLLEALPVAIKLGGNCHPQETFGNIQRLSRPSGWGRGRFYWHLVERGQGGMLADIPWRTGPTPQQNCLAPFLLFFVIQREGSAHVPLEVFLHEHPVHSGSAAQGRDGVSAKRLDDGERHGCQMRLITGHGESRRARPSLSLLRMCSSQRYKTANIYYLLPVTVRPLGVFSYWEE